MKVRTFVLLGALVGALSVFGCSDDNGGSGGGTAGSGGTAGTGGSAAAGGSAGAGGMAGEGGSGGMPAEVCTLGICAEEGLAKTACLMAYDICIDAGERTPEECNTIAETANCEESNP